MDQFKDALEKAGYCNKQSEEKITDNTCPDCGADCWMIKPWKECKKCKHLFDKNNERVWPTDEM